ncbi:hypothetical protein AU184_20810 [Mycolicibacterium novocastrense]|uniref:hypothetical protein n=1 Tax=Mycobacteriaceae TaxID=1762 RepID=UPI000748A9CF|nr:MULTISPECIES: hypothetical protein [Mycobacteriaceae]KUH67777.1 hypothetical protein AU183_22480 [Mycolicibacterium novocastrense]KUH70213.1 hypothetical protein AU184_20810 [Mycolicibacterium novocastrense]KUH75870.1 hypothetical protein AU072_05425 [Mycolicibacterium novocastrense]KUI34926.1 hypothetical protein AU197_10830 [Mycobacterium sp. IS-1590]KUI47526.1 hypothetical protein AU198_24700 [Mycobacterium sp. GA-1199]
MRERALAPADNPTAEAIATTGLFLIFTAIIAVAVSLSSWGASDAPLAAAAGLVAVVSFTASLLCFGKQSADD